MSSSILYVEALTSNTAALGCGGLLGIVKVNEVIGAGLDLIGLAISDQTEATDPELCARIQERKVGV